MSFAAFMPRSRWLDGHLVLARRIGSPRFRRIDTYSPRHVVHAFRLTAADEVDEESTGWLAEAYRVGEQRHLSGCGTGGTWGCASPIRRRRPASSPPPARATHKIALRGVADVDGEVLHLLRVAYEQSPVP